MIRSRMSRGLALGTTAFASGALIFALAPAASAATTDGDTPASESSRIGQRLDHPYFGAKLVNSADGTTVSHVVDGSPADLAGLESGDVVLSINGVDLDTRSDVRDAFADVEAGDAVTVVISHDGADETVTITAGESADRPEMPAAEDVPWIGARLMRVEGTDGVVVRSVAADGPADAAGLIAGDVVTAIDGTPVTEWWEAREMLRDEAPGDTVELTVDRDGTAVDTTVTLGSHDDAGVQSRDGMRAGNREGHGAGDGSGAGDGQQRGAQRGAAAGQSTGDAAVDA